LIKTLEIIGLVLIGGTVYAFLGMIGDPIQWYVFFGCAAGALVTIIYRNKLRQKRNESQA
jgi:membrane associated rhomboid family serine protease